ncbi:TPA: hypothetical protein N0F65_008492 [Lagenidium giganteum]|uniref:Uncharacterized protein n=1 Tax=Lagenidium giganteum TaxID=4803 RepID=A0AAV2Z447_9STRA|nr:TPA: hypothetical protein N0F65_008492 [Lagenidium giganteum]
MLTVAVLAVAVLRQRLEQQHHQHRQYRRSPSHPFQRSFVDST